LAEFEERFRYVGPYYRIHRWYSDDGPLFGTRKTRAVFLLMATFSLGCALACAFILLLGGRVPDLLLGTSLIGMSVVVVLGGLEFFAKRALDGAHRRRWPGD
jgi:hypothetical protein